MRRHPPPQCVERGSAILYGMNNLAEREPQIAFRSVEPRAARPELPPSRQSRCYCSRASLINLMTTSVHVCTHLLANGILSRPSRSRSPGDSRSKCCLSICLIGHGQS
jgi:hypothetical protein